MKRGARRFSAITAAAAVLLTAALLTPPARAEAMTTSEAGISFIKDFEGFRSQVYWDSGSAFIGYGTICKSTDYPNGITEETGDMLLRQALATKENTVNQFLTKYNILLTQNQYDALLDLTYNIGTGWINSSYRLYNILKNGVTGYSDMDIVNAIGTWCHQGKTVVDRLVERRIREVKLFLYNNYDGSDPHSYRYLTFDAGSGDIDNSIQFFEYGKPYGNIDAPTQSGYTFAGWVTKSGAAVTPSSTVSQNLAVTASWTTGGTPASGTLFPDVAPGDWFYKYVTDLGAGNIIKGYTDGTFRPAGTVTNGEALSLILLAVGFAPQPATDSNWASGYLALAMSKGIVNQGEITDLNEAINRQMIAQIAAKSLGLPPIETPEATFADTTDGFVLALYHVNIISGSLDGSTLVYKPQSSITRAEISAVIWRLYNSGIVES